MYARHFGLNQPPFSIAPDPRYLFMSERHREALAHLLYGVSAGGGFVVLTGEIGAGKTTVCRAFLEQIPERCEVAYIFNPKLTVEELLATICAEFRISCSHPVAGAVTVKDYVDALNEYLLRTHAIARNNVLIIDEAQSLSTDVLEQLRLLTNLETNERKLLQIVLIGQPELRTMLAQPGMQQLAQRVIARYHLDALTEGETSQYVRHRLAVAGLSGAMPFDARALRRVYGHSRGVPRRINLLCDRALLGAYSKDRSVVDRRTVDEAAREVLASPDFAATRRRTRERAAMLGLGLATGALLVGALAWMLGSDTTSRPPTEQAAVAPAPPPAAPTPGATDAERAPAPQTAAGAPAPQTAAGAAAPGGGAAADDAPRADAAPTPPGVPAAFDLPTGFASLMGAERQAWEELAQAWSIDIADQEPCAAARRQQVQCFRSSKVTLATIRLLDRPGILTLRDGDNRAAYAMLGGLTNKSATLRIGGERRTVSLVSLADYWRGEFATFWRVPPGYPGKDSAGRPSADARWLAQQLAALRGDSRPIKSPVDEADLRGRVHAFQLTQGLPSDGIAGPVTLMQLNRGLGIGEPHLEAEK